MPPEAKIALDKIIRKARVHFYKPFQIAEILYHHRVNSVPQDPGNLESYRNTSKRWRDAVSLRLVGRVSTSSQKYQDNLFDANAMPPRLLATPAAYNRENEGVVESYIYHRFKQRRQSVLDAHDYLANSTLPAFSLHHFLNFFEQQALKRSVGKAFEIVVYALFSSLATALQAQVTVAVANPDPQILSDFERFI